MANEHERQVPKRPRRLNPRVLQRFLKRTVVAGAILALLLVAVVAKFEALEASSALDHAVIARNVASGQGLTTAAVRPLAAGLAGAEAERVIMVPPLYPVVLAGAMRAFGATDQVVALASVFFAVLTLGLTYAICMRAFGERIAVGATGLLALTVPFIQHAISGTEVPFLAFLITAFLGSLLWWPDSRRTGSAWGPIASGVLVAACWLTRHEMIVLVVPMLLWWLYDEKRLWWKRLIWTLLPVVLVAGAWTVHSSLLLGRPIVSASSYMLLSDTSLYPGDTVQRLFDEIPSHPWTTAVEHPGMIGLKFLGNLGQLYYAIATVGNPYVTMFFLVGVVLATVRRERSLAHWAVLLAMVLLMLVTSLYDAMPALLVCFVPMIAVLAARDLATLLEMMPPEGAKQTRARTRPFLKWGRMALGLTRARPGRDRLVRVGIVALLIVVSFPMAHYLFIQPPARQSPLTHTARELGTRSYDLVLTNVPSAVAWFGNVRAMEIPVSSRQLAEMEARGIRPDAVYVAPTRGASEMTFEGFRRVDDPEIAGLLWVRVE